MREGETIEGSRATRNRPYFQCNKARTNVDWLNLFDETCLRRTVHWLMNGNSMSPPAIPALMDPFAPPPQSAPPPPPPPPRRCVLYGCNTYTPSGGDSTSSDDNIAGHRPVRPPFVVSRLRSDFETANALLALSAPRTQLECCQAARSHRCRGRHERAPRPMGGHDGQRSVHRLQSFAAAQP